MRKDLLCTVHYNKGSDYLQSEIQHLNDKALGKLKSQVPCLFTLVSNTTLQS